MKICNICGAQWDDSSKFCNKCGSPLVNMDDAMDKTVSAESGYNDQYAIQSTADEFAQQKINIENKKNKKVSKGKVIFISIIAGVLAIIIALTVMFFTSSAYKVNKCMKDKDFKDAISEYRSGVEDKFIQETLLDMLLKGRVDEVYNGYKSGDIDYDDAVAELEALYKMGFDGAKEKMQKVTVSNDSVNALKTADEYYENGEYEKAIEEYNKIPQSDEKYDEAQEKLSAVYTDYIDSVVSSAKSKNRSGDYKAAVKLIETAYDILPDGVDTSELDDVKEESLASYKTQISDEVSEFVEDEDYESAFALIDEAIDFDNNDFFNDLKESTENDYVESVTTIVEDYLEDEDYVSAKRVSDNALTVLPDNSDLEDLQKKVEKATPTFLLDVCEPYSVSNTYKSYVNGETVKMGGNAYTNSFSYSDTAYAIFNIDGKYSKLSFYLGHVDGTDMTDSVFKLYCDGVLKTEIQVKAEDLPKKVEIDITGVKQIKFTSDEVPWSPVCGIGSVSVK